MAALLVKLKPLSIIAATLGRRELQGRVCVCVCVTEVKKGVQRIRVIIQTQQ